MVCRTVLKEIDDFKAGGNARRARRARELSSRFRQMVKNKQPDILRLTNPKVVLDFVPRLTQAYVLPELLNTAKKDDRIVAEALAAIQALGRDGALLTDDTGIMLTADEVQLACVAIPENWRLPPEKDERDKQIDELKAQVTRLSRTVPELTVAVSSDGQLVIEPLVVQRTVYPPLPPALIKELTLALEKRYLIKTDFSREEDKGIALAEFTLLKNQRTVAGLLANHLAGSLGPQEWQAPSGSLIQAYHKKYAAWTTNVQTFFENLHTILPGQCGKMPIAFSLHNRGSVPADYVLVDIETVGGFLIEKCTKKTKTSAPATSFPAPPEAPAWKSVTSDSFGLTLQALQGALGRTNPLLHEPSDYLTPRLFPASQHSDDPYTFFWRNGSPSRWVAAWEFRCTEFRHHAEPEVFAPLVVAPADNSVTRGAMKFRASARNLPKPIECTVAFRVDVVTGDTEAAARSLMLENPWIMPSQFE